MGLLSTNAMRREDLIRQRRPIESVVDDEPEVGDGIESSRDRRKTQRKLAAQHELIIFF